MAHRWVARLVRVRPIVWGDARDNVTAKRTARKLRAELWRRAVRVEELDRRSDISLCCGVGRVAWNAYQDALAKCRAAGCLDD